MEGDYKNKSETLAALKKKILSPLKLCEHHLKIIYKCVREGEDSSQQPKHPLRTALTTRSV